jgi:hypothetical protein
VSASLVHLRSAANLSNLRIVHPSAALPTPRCSPPCFAALA